MSLGSSRKSAAVPEGARTGIVTARIGTVGSRPIPPDLDENDTLSLFEEKEALPV
jgi:hypothetical protein